MVDNSANLTVTACLSEGLKGFTTGNRLVVPFHAHVIAVRVGMGYSAAASGGSLITDFSTRSSTGSVEEAEYGMNIYLLKYRDLREEFGQHKGTVQLKICEKSDDIFDEKNHQRLLCTFRDDIGEVNISLA